LFQVRARGRDRVRQLGFVALKSARSLLRLGKLLLTLRAVAVQFARSLFERGKFAMQAVVADAQLRKRAAQFAVFDALLVKLADCCVDRFGQAAEGLLNVAFAPIRCPASISRLRSFSLSSPRRAPMSARVNSLRFWGTAPSGSAEADAADCPEAGALRAPKPESIQTFPSPATPAR
jgi:hypothetical protein